MKFLLVLVASLIALTIPSIFASHELCGGLYQCPDKYSCLNDVQYGGIYSCLMTTDELNITQTVTSRWADNNGEIPYAQIIVQLKNIGNRTLSDVILSPLCLDSLKDSNALWGVSYADCKVHLPEYSNLAPNAVLTFGYIAKGNDSLPMSVEQVVAL
ncbi:hypothetical protein CYY_000201 [Polysphondylium violaceum]|uniref:Carbohydrate binding domain-containing protein n=1 Tax=Polysphondylium violaceum TaxID=133409 RepID=A0A8J4UXC5_9MYCE|nr:hypothetical protein CYY_000201 [Polysphondylium violaceum]